MSEIWKPIKSYEGVYEVSSHGRVRSLDRVMVNSDGKSHRLRGKQICPSTGKYGHKRVVLYSPGRPAETWQVHSLVLRAFVSERPDGLICRHLDGNPANNRLGNLTWGTPSENMYDKARHGVDHQRNKTHCPLGHPLQEPNLQERKIKVGWRCCKACHQARSDNYNGSELTYEQLADMRYFMIMTGQKFKHGTRNSLEQGMYRDAQEWLKGEENEGN